MTAWNQTYTVIKKNHAGLDEQNSLYAREKRKTKKKFSDEKSEEVIGRRIILQNKYMNWIRVAQKQQTKSQGSIILGRLESISLRLSFRVFWDVMICQLANVYWHFEGYQTLYQLTGINIQEDRNIQQCRCETLKPCNKILRSIRPINRRSCLNKMPGRRYKHS